MKKIYVSPLTEVIAVEPQQMAAGTTLDPNSPNPSVVVGSGTHHGAFGSRDYDDWDE